MRAVCLALFCALARVVAQDHLTPEPGILAEEDEYFAKIREVFGDTYRGENVLQVVFLPSFELEEIAGIRKTEKGFEAFASKPSSQIWATYTIWAIETGKQRWNDEHGDPIPAEKNPMLPTLKKDAPSDFRQITVHTDTRPIGGPVVERIERVWQKMLLEARHPANPVLGTDGETFHFSMWIRAHGIVSASVWSPDRGRTLAFTYLAEALADYARGTTDEKKLISFIKRVER